MSIPSFLPEFDRLSTLAGSLSLMETDEAFASLAKELLVYLSAVNLHGLHDGMSTETRMMGVLHIGYVAGIEAYEREHKVEAEEG